MGYICMYAKGYGFAAILVINRAWGLGSGPQHRRPIFLGVPLFPYPTPIQDFLNKCENTTNHYITLKIYETMPVNLRGKLIC